MVVKCCGRAGERNPSTSGDVFADFSSLKRKPLGAPPHQCRKNHHNRFLHRVHGVTCSGVFDAVIAPAALLRKGLSDLAGRFGARRSPQIGQQKAERDLSCGVYPAHAHGAARSCGRMEGRSTHGLDRFAATLSSPARPRAKPAHSRKPRARDCSRYGRRIRRQTFGRGGG